MNKKINLKRKQMAVDDVNPNKTVKKPIKPKSTNQIKPSKNQKGQQKNPIPNMQTMDVIEKNDSYPQQSQQTTSKSANVKTQPNDQDKKQMSPVQHKLFLYQKKKRLMIQLEKVKVQLKSLGDQKEKSKQKKTQPFFSTQQKEQQAFTRVSSFIKKIRKQKQQYLLKKKKSVQKLVQHKIQSESKAYQALLEQQLRIKQQRRKQIHNKIQQRKKLSQIRQKLNRSSNSLVQELINSKHPDVPSYKSQRSKTQIQQEKISRVQSHSYKTKLCRKKFQISPFLSQIFKEELQKKKQEEQKILQRRRVIERHRQYAQKSRARTRFSAYQSLTPSLSQKHNSNL